MASLARVVGETALVALLGFCAAWGDTSEFLLSVLVYDSFGGLFVNNQTGNLVILASEMTTATGADNGSWVPRLVSVVAFVVGIITLRIVLGILHALRRKRCCMLLLCNAHLHKTFSSALLSLEAFFFCITMGLNWGLGDPPSSKGLFLAGVVFASIAFGLQSAASADSGPFRELGNTNIISSVLTSWGQQLFIITRKCTDAACRLRGGGGAAAARRSLAAQSQSMRQDRGEDHRIDFRVESDTGVFLPNEDAESLAGPGATLLPAAPVMGPCVRALQPSPLLMRCLTHRFFRLSTILVFFFAGAVGAALAGPSLWSDVVPTSMLTIAAIGSVVYVLYTSRFCCNAADGSFSNFLLPKCCRPAGFPRVSIAPAPVAESAPTFPLVAVIPTRTTPSHQHQSPQDATLRPTGAASSEMQQQISSPTVPRNFDEPSHFFVCSNIVAMSLLASVSGWADAVTYRLYDFFVANHTGNFVGASLGLVNGESILTFSIAIVTFTLGGFVVAAIASCAGHRADLQSVHGALDERKRHAALAASLCVECGAFALFTSLLVAFSAEIKTSGINGWAALVVSLVGAFAFGVQNSCTTEVALVSLPTTGMTVVIAKAVDSIISVLVIATKCTIAPTAEVYAHLKRPTFREITLDRWALVTHRALYFSSILGSFTCGAIAGSALSLISYATLFIPAGILLFVAGDCMVALLRTRTPQPSDLAMPRIAEVQ